MEVLSAQHDHRPIKKKDLVFVNIKLFDFDKWHGNETNPPSSTTLMEALWVNEKLTFIKIINNWDLK